MRARKNIQSVTATLLKTSAVTIHGYSFQQLDKSLQDIVEEQFLAEQSVDLTTENVSTKEVPIGTKDGSNRKFELRHDPIKRSEHVYFNGQLLAAGAGNDYIMEGNLIIMNQQPAADDAVVCTYFIDFQDQFLVDADFYATDFDSDYDESVYDDFFDEDSVFFDDFKDDFFDDFDFDGDGVDDFEDHDSRFDPFDPSFNSGEFNQSNGFNNYNPFQ